MFGAASNGCILCVDVMHGGEDRRRCHCLRMLSLLSADNVAKIGAHVALGSRTLAVWG
jgi:hypothetical protein